jgi:hypothetical protein
MTSWVKDIKFSFEHAMIPQQSILETAERLRPMIRNMANAISEGYDGDLSVGPLPATKTTAGWLLLSVGSVNVPFIGMS